MHLSFLCCGGQGTHCPLESPGDLGLSELSFMDHAKKENNLTYLSEGILIVCSLQN